MQSGNIIRYLFSLQAVFIDYQNLQPGPLGRDIWNYLYTATDSDWRKQHFVSSMNAYYKAFLPYMKMAKIDMNFEEFLADVNNYRKV